MCRGFEMMSPNMWFVWIIPVILVIIIGVSLFMIKRSNSEDVISKSNVALDILNERYAKGEIDEEEYNRRKKILQD